MIRTVRTALMTFALVAAVASTAEAVTVTHSYSVSSAVGSGSDHSLWLKKGIKKVSKRDFDFEPGATLSFFDDGTGTLTGRVVSQSNANAFFDVAFDYDQDFDRTPQPKQENGFSPANDPNGWQFHNFSGGRLTGGGDLDGLVLDASQRPKNGKHPLQIGQGANGKNSSVGAAQWFYAKRALNGACTSNLCKLFKSAQQGDINVDLLLSPPVSQTVAVPLPGALPMLTSAFALLGLGYVGHSRRRHS